MAESTCTVDGCIGTYLARGWCMKHYTRWRKTGSLELTRPQMKGNICAVEGCDREANCQGWCKQHYERWRTTGTTSPAPGPKGGIKSVKIDYVVCAWAPCSRLFVVHGSHRHSHRRFCSVKCASRKRVSEQPTKICSIAGCDRKLAAHSWCDVHYYRWRRHGDPLPERPVRPGNFRVKVDVLYLNCSYIDCRKLFVVRASRPRQFCSAACRNRARARDVVTPAPPDTHDTELCAWWVKPYCNKRVVTQDLCQRHYDRSRRRDQPPPPFKVVAFKWHSVTSADPSERVGDCITCGPGVAIRQQGVKYLRCNGGAVAKSREMYTGWSEHDYDIAVIAQGNRCAICGQPPKGKKAVLYADHCHVNRERRALLCSLCNNMLGFAADNPAVLEAGAAYLRDHDDTKDWLRLTVPGGRLAS